MGVPVGGRASTFVCPNRDDECFVGQPVCGLGRGMYLFPSSPSSLYTHSVSLVYSTALARVGALFITDLAHMMDSSGLVAGESL